MINVIWLRRIVWSLAAIDLVILLGFTILVILNPGQKNVRYWEVLSGAVVALGASLLGVVILHRQPRNRIGWLWLFFGLTMSFFSLAYANSFAANLQSIEQSSTVLVLLLFSEVANLFRWLCLILLILWFPNGQLPSARWRFIYYWVGIAFILTNLGIFKEKINWTETEGLVRGIGVINNPLGFIPNRYGALVDALVPIGFFSLVLILIFAVLSITLRYRSAGRQIKAQILWFVLGSAFFVVVFITMVFSQPAFAGVITNLATIPFYLAIGFSITRYRLYDIDLIIRKTLVYGALTAALALVFFGGVALLQFLFSTISNQRSEIGIVISTLAIAALFNPLRNRIQAGIDRRFYRRKYDAEQSIIRFAEAARGETDMEQLSAELLAVVADTMQPVQLSLWLRPVTGRKT